MAILGAGWALRPALLFVLLVLLKPVQAQALVVTHEEGARLLTLDLRETARWCVLWSHSVSGFLVKDCYRLEDGVMLLTSHHTPDFAAGLGPLQGRGELETDAQGGYVIRGIDEPVAGNRYVLRVGSPAVNHRIQHGDRIYSLSEIAAGARVIVAVQEERRCGHPR